MPKFIKSDTAKEYRLKYGMQMPSLALARIMYNENKELFTNVDNARSALRYIEGKRGKKEFTKNIKQSPFFMQNERPRNPYNLPDSEETKYEPYYIKAKKLAVLSDVHIPYHSIDAITATFDKISNEKPDAILLNGDFIDMYSLSRFQKDPRKRSVAHELQSAREVLDILATFGAKIYFK